ncbi:ABC transporter substrate-binding protein [Thermodesulfobacteriota bacterium]
MKKVLLMALFFFLISQGPAVGQVDILVIQSIRVKPYEDALTGFQSVNQARFRRLVLSEMAATDVKKRIHEIRPAMILAIGEEALSSVKAIETIPIVYLMVLNPQSIILEEKNIIGISMHIPQDNQLAVLIESLPHVNSVGLLYHPDRTGPFIKGAQKAAEEIGVKLIAQKIYDAKEAPALIMSMKERIDVFWMIPDITVITPETVEFLLLFSIKNRIPLFTFSEKYVEMGAFMSMDIDAFDMGRQAAEMAERIRVGKTADHISPVYARKAIVSKNLMIAKKLGIYLPTAIAGDMKSNQKVLRISHVIN